ncbi:hypothetical protein T09_6758 [Trichinella sp. T9]|nr:hypothetical protein T09_6758 [Trichinella sp. T9]
MALCPARICTTAAAVYDPAIIYTLNYFFIIVDEIERSSVINELSKLWSSSADDFDDDVSSCLDPEEDLITSSTSATNETS